MEDFLGRKIDVGDNVVVANMCNELILAQIIGAWPEKIKIRYYDDWHDVDVERTRDPNTVLKVDGPDLIVYLLKK